MAEIKVKKNIVKGSDINVENGSLTYIRNYHVSGLEGEDVLLQALLVEGVPRFGFRDDTIPEAICRGTNPKPATDAKTGVELPDQVVVTAKFIAEQYGLGANPIQIAFDSTIRQVQTDTGTDGKTITVPYAGAKIPQRAEVPKLVKDKIITFTRWFPIRSTTPSLEYPTPIEKLKDKYDGAINTDDFRGGKKHEWMASVKGDTQDLGRSYTVTIMLEHREESWDEWAWFRLPNGEVPRDADKVKGVGVTKIVNLYKEAAFKQIEQDLKDL